MCFVNRCAATLIVASLVGLSVSTPALALDWQVIYQTDFSTCGEWTTNNGANYYCAGGTYFSRQVNGSDEYAYTPLPTLQAGYAWRIEYEIQPAYYTWAGNGRFGLMIEDMRISGLPATFTLITLNFHYGDGGHQITLAGYDSGEGYDAVIGAFTVGTWYSVVIEWDPRSNTLSAIVTERDTGTAVGEGAFTIDCVFADIDRLGMSVVGDHYASGATGETRFDNVMVSQAPLSGNVRLLPDDGAAGDGFGGSVALSGDMALAGARYDDDHGSNSGSAYVFQNAGGVWTQVAKLTAADGASDDYFGNSVALLGDTALVGAHYADHHGTNSGSAYVFQSAGDVWTQAAEVTAQDGAEYDNFGGSVALSGDMALVGADNDDDNGSNSGSAYVFERDSGGPDNWGQVAKLTADDGAQGDEFGSSVALEGDRALVGASFDDVNETDSGSAYVFDLAAGYYDLGDLNCDHAVNGFDIDPFVLVLDDTEEYMRQYPDCDPWLADINQDGWINGFDIDSFVALLGG